MSEDTKTDDKPQTPPLHLSVNPKSEHFNVDVLQRGVGIKFKGRTRTDIEEYNIPEGWVRVQAGKTVERLWSYVAIRDRDAEGGKLDISAVGAVVRSGREEPGIRCERPLSFGPRPRM